MPLRHGMEGHQYANVHFQIPQMLRDYLKKLHERKVKVQVGEQEQVIWSGEQITSYVTPTWALTFLQKSFTDQTAEHWKKWSLSHLCIGHNVTKDHVCITHDSLEWESHSMNVSRGYELCQVKCHHCGIVTEPGSLTQDLHIMYGNPLKHCRTTLERARRPIHHPSLQHTSLECSKMKNKTKEYDR